MLRDFSFCLRVHWGYKGEYLFQHKDMPFLPLTDGQIAMENAIFFKNLVGHLLSRWVSDAKCVRDKNQHTELRSAFTELSNSPGRKAVAFAITWNTTRQSHSWTRS